MGNKKAALRKIIEEARFGHIDESIWDTYSDYEALCRKEHDNEGLVYVQFCMGEACFRLGQYLDSVSRLNNLICNHRHQMGDELIGRTLNLLGMSHYTLGYSPTALENYLSALDYSNKLEQPTLKVILHINIGWLYRECGDYFKALSTYKEGLKILSTNISNSNYNLGALCNAYIAQIYFKMDKPDAALPYVTAAKNLSQGDKAVFYDIAIKNALLRYYAHINDRENFVKIAEGIIEAAMSQHDFLEFSEAYIDSCEYLISVDRVYSRRLLTVLWQPVIVASGLSFLKLRLQRLEILYSKTYLSTAEFQRNCGDYFVILDKCETVSKQNMVSELSTMEKLRFAEKERQVYFERSQKDLMTGVLNKVSFEQCVSDEIHKRKSAALQPCAFALIDIDCFKNINDTLGHSNGDQIILCLSDESKKIFNDECVFGRVGGDEFGIFWKSISSFDRVVKEIEILSCNFQSAVDAFFRSRDMEYPKVTISAGLVYEDSSETDYENLFGRADTQLYLAKKDGRDTVKIEMLF